MPPEYDFEAKPPPIRRLLVQPGMIILFVVFLLGWCAMATFGSGGMLAIFEERGNTILSPTTPEVTPDVDQQFEELLGTIVGPEAEINTATPAPLQGTTPTPQETRRNSNFGDIFRTRDP